MTTETKVRFYISDEQWDDGVPLCGEHYDIWIKNVDTYLLR